MEPAGFAFGLVAMCKDTYLTVRFIQKTIQTMQEHKEERDELTLRFDVQIERLKGLSRLFYDAKSNKLDHELLERSQNTYLLNTVFRVLKQLDQILNEYSKLATNHHQRSPEEVNDSLDFLFTEESSMLPSLQDKPKRQTPQDSNKSQSKSPASTIWQRFMRQPPAPSSAPKASKKASFVPEHVRWLFLKPELEKVLNKFNQWNGELESLISPLLNGLGFFKDEDRQKRLKNHDDVNFFDPHLKMHRLAEIASNNETTNKELTNEVPVPVESEQAKTLKDQKRVITEYKRMILKEDNLSDPDDGKIRSLMRDLHGPTLAALLRTAKNHSFRTLPLNSYARDDENLQFIFFFDYPSGTLDQEPISLYNVILSQDQAGRPTLKDRFLIAQAVARAISVFHSDGWLHKNIRGHAVKFFFVPGKIDPGKIACDFESPYLTDFQLSRPVKGKTRKWKGGADPEYDVYQHPERYGEPETNFTKTHDIYSLGVVLLEIGLWQTAKELYDEVIEGEYDSKPPSDGLPKNTMQKEFIFHAENRLAHRMGSSYRDAVVACLEHDWDQLGDDAGLASEFQDMVVEKVSMKACMD